MALNKNIVVDKIEVLEMGQIQIRTATVIDEDGTEHNECLYVWCPLHGWWVLLQHC